MGAARKVTGGLVLVMMCYVVVRLNTAPPLPPLDPDPYWGPGDRRHEDTRVRPFKIEIPAKDVEDLQARLALPPRLAPPLAGTKFTYGMDSTTMAVILKYWRDSYDWKKREARLNSFKHFKTRIEGLNIHFMRASPPANSGKTVRPLLLLHGWPGSFVEFMDILPLLTTPRPDSEVVFDVICPSLPGYGFSEAAAKPGMNTVAIAQIMTKLMKRLGFDKFYSQGGDWGSVVTLDIGTVFPDNVYGVHVNFLLWLTWGVQAKIILGALLPSGAIMDPELEKRWYPLSKSYGSYLRQSGYFHLQATKPDTFGVSLNSSPVGLAAYFLEKFIPATNAKFLELKHGGLLDPDFPIPLDAMLDNICVYWFTGTITSSMRLYAEGFGQHLPLHTLSHIPTTVPAGLSNFKHEIILYPRNLAAHKLQNLVSFTSHDVGGHFAAMEVPKLLGDDIFNFANVVERQLKENERRTKTDEL